MNKLLNWLNRVLGCKKPRTIGEMAKGKVAPKRQLLDPYKDNFYK